MNISDVTKAIKGQPLAHVRYIVRNGKHRKVFEPNRAMEELHRRLLRFLRRDLAPFMPSAMCQSGTWALKNLLLHRGNRFFCRIDLKNAYSNTSIRPLARAIRALDWSIGSEEEVYELLALYCSDGHGGLAQGLPASQDLFNIFCEEYIDARIREEIEMHWNYRSGENLVFTRYVDDLLISNTVPIKDTALITQVRKIIAEAGFEENSWKTMFTDLERHGPIVITGRALDQYGNIRLSGRRERSLEGMLFEATRRSETFAPPQRRKKRKSDPRAVLKGHMDFFLETLRTRRHMSWRERQILQLYAHWGIAHGVDVTAIAELLHGAR